MLYDTAARANELLLVNIEDLDVANHEAIVIGKGGNAEYVSWSSLTARRLPHIINGRTKGPLFISSRRPVRAPAHDDLCPHTGRARLSYPGQLIISEENDNRNRHESEFHSPSRSVRISSCLHIGGRTPNT